jgi:transcriptional regulator with XRE-family HTH domain
VLRREPMLAFLLGGSKDMAMTHPGDRLREIRTKLGITTREVAARSRQIAERQANEEYSISHGWITQIENGAIHASSVQKLFSLACIYGLSFAELLQLIGMDINKIVAYHDQMPAPKTHLVRFHELNQASGIEVPVPFDTRWNLNQTHLLRRALDIWGTVPFALLRSFDLRNRLYGYVGLNDHTLDPLIRPGSFVVIDRELRSLKAPAAHTEFHRPVYFVDLGKEYACGWCELLGSKLLLLAHPLSRCKTRQFNYPGEAEIVGQVTGVAMQIVEPNNRMSASTEEVSKP